MEDETVPSTCPVCSRDVIGSFGTHLQLHSKQDLIYTIINQQDALGLFDYRKPSSSCSENQVVSKQELSFRSTLPPKRTQKRSTSSRRKNSTSQHGRDLRDGSRQCHATSPDSEAQPSGSKSSGKVPVQGESGISTSTLGEPFRIEVTENGEEDNPIQSESSEIMPMMQICSFISDPGVEDSPNEPNPELQTLYPVNHFEDTNSLTSNSSYIKYIIETPVSGGTDAIPQELDEWILPSGRSIPVFSGLSHGPGASADAEDPLSLDSEHSCLIIPDRIDHGQPQDDVDLMTDEEIPPRGEISEYEESNTSSHHSDELNKSGSINIGSTLGSMFIGARRLSSVVDQRRNARKGKSVRKTLQPDSPAAPQTSMKSGMTHPGANSHKCPYPNCNTVGSIFELAQHQVQAHQRNYKEIKMEPQLNLQLKEEAMIAPAPIVKSSGYCCFYCNFQGNKLRILHEHILEAHPGKPLKQKEYECKTCGKIFQKRMNLNKHLLIHGVKKFQCFCGKAFTSGFKLMEHGRVHTKDYPFECVHCQRNFRTPSLLKAHILRSHPQPGDRKCVIPKKIEFFCSVCSRVLHSKRSYAKHLELHNETICKCPICYESFPRNAILTRHIRVAHDSSYETKESKDCPICFKKMHPNSMKSHMRIHNNEKPFSCAVCGKAFRTAANLTSHTWSHTNAEKPFKCTHCSKSYLFKKCLEAHLIVHKKRSFHFVCNECGMKFTSKVNLKRHCQEHFSEKKYKCSLCLKKFHRKYYLVEHERIHNGSKPYTCTICGKSSTTRSNHRAHIKIHDARESGTLEG